MAAQGGRKAAGSSRVEKQAADKRGHRERSARARRQHALGRTCMGSSGTAPRETTAIGTPRAKQKAYTSAAACGRMGQPEGKRGPRNGMDGTRAGGTSAV